MDSRNARLIAPALALVFSIGASTACGLHLSLNAEAQDKWSRDYTLSEGGTLEIRNTSGRIEIETGDGDAVTVVAERTVKAATDEAAQEALASFEIEETVSADKIVLDSTNKNLGVTFNMNRIVNYTIRLPRSANLTIRATNGDVDVTGLGGRFDVQTTNGRILARGLQGGANASATNGAVNLTMATLGPDGVVCETTNGQITVTLPTGADADLSARVTNGAISHEGLDLEVIEQTRRRLDATIGGGGPEIRLTTTNGRIRVQGR